MGTLLKIRTSPNSFTLGLGDKSFTPVLWPITDFLYRTEFSGLQIFFCISFPYLPTWVLFYFQNFNSRVLGNYKKIMELSTKSFVSVLKRNRKNNWTNVVTTIFFGLNRTIISENSFMPNSGLLQYVEVKRGFVIFKTSLTRLFATLAVQLQELSFKSKLSISWSSIYKPIFWIWDIPSSIIRF